MKCVKILVDVGFHQKASMFADEDDNLTDEERRGNATIKTNSLKSLSFVKLSSSSANILCLLMETHIYKNFYILHYSVTIACT